MPQLANVSMFVTLRAAGPALSRAWLRPGPGLHAGPLAPPLARRMTSAVSTGLLKHVDSMLAKHAALVDELTTSTVGGGWLPPVPLPGHLTA